MDKYTPVIGLEIHAELKTRTKMFCDSANLPAPSGARPAGDPDAVEPNAHICPVCMAHPGTLPTINRQAVKHIIKVGYAVGGRIADFTEFDRKHYFYPDIPKGYQISQYASPLVQGGSLKGVELTRIHLEEDTARSIHDQGDYSLVDFNRAGVPLMELVTEPKIRSGEEAAAFAKELQLLLRYLGAGEANMEKGQMRVEANVSVSSDPERLGTKVEVKNLNSFRSVERAVAYEIERHTSLLQSGKEVVQDTRGFDEVKGETVSQRQKEESHDYRYFPEPDLPAIWISRIPEFSRKAIEVELPELPWQKRERYGRDFALEEATAEIFIQAPNWAEYFETLMNSAGDDEQYRKLLVNYLTSDFLGMVKNDPQRGGEEAVDPAELIKPKAFAKVVELTQAGELSSRGAKDLLAALYRGEGEDPAVLADQLGLKQVSDTESLRPVVTEIIKENPEEAESFRSGSENVLQFLVGQGMKKTKGGADPQKLQELLKEELQK